MKNKFKFKIGQVVTIKRNQSNEFWKIKYRFKGPTGKPMYGCSSYSLDSMGIIKTFFENQMHIPFGQWKNI